MAFEIRVVDLSCRGGSKTLSETAQDKTSNPTRLTVTDPYLELSALMRQVRLARLTSNEAPDQKVLETCDLFSVAKPAFQVDHGSTGYAASKILRLGPRPSTTPRRRFRSTGTHATIETESTRNETPACFCF